MHLKRWITGLIALPFLIFLVYKGGVLFTILISIAGLVALWEYYRIVFNGEDKPISNIILLWGYGINFAIIWSTFLVGPDLSLSVIGLNLIVVALISLFQFKTDQTVLDVVIKQLQGIIYIPVLLSFLVLIREGSSGMIWVFVLLAVIFAGDTGAYYVGSYLGRHKLSPAVSPGKTIEGSIGGLAVNLVLGGVGKYFFLSGLPWGLSLLFFLTVGIAGQVGDLFESELKRSSGIKDSGGILPGHGGILDRIDALLFASPVAYIFIRFIF
ncbi:MAG: phosphatidate cytidylyltransferase [Desulfobacterales bacterium]|jgi:phosphatidate cytidylyltransferase|nr:phosphatidate cytidylyltransferase [Desulfobacterales bacterium]